MHADEVPIDEDAARALIADQFPHLGDRSVRRCVTDGTVNAIFRVGEDLAARFPLRLMEASAAREWLEVEAAAQGDLANVTSFPTPRPVGIGEPGHGYPMPFAVQTWVAGRVPRVGEYADSVGFADDLARLIGELRGAPTRGRTFAGSGRGGDLRDHDAWIAECIALNAPWFDPAVTGGLWARLRDLPRIDPDVMNHSDLVPAMFSSTRVVSWVSSTAAASVRRIRPWTWSRPGIFSTPAGAIA